MQEHYKVIETRWECGTDCYIGPDGIESDAKVMFPSSLWYSQNMSKNEWKKEVSLLEALDDYFQLLGELDMTVNADNKSNAVVSNVLT